MREPRLNILSESEVSHILRVIDSCETEEQLKNASLWATNVVSMRKEFDKRDIWKTGVAYDWLRYINGEYASVYDMIMALLGKKVKELTRKGRIKKNKCDFMENELKAKITAEVYDLVKDLDGDAIDLLETVPKMVLSYEEEKRKGGKG